MENLEYLFTAYFVIWLLPFFYIFNLDRKQKKLFEELEKLKKLTGPDRS